MAKEDQSSAAEKDFSANYLASRKRRRRNRVIGALAIIAVAGGVYYWQSREVEVVSEDQDLIVTIGYGDIENSIPAAGSLQPKEIVPVGARASGQLEEILVEVGDRVEEGQLLARIDAEEQELRVKSSRLSLENQRNQVEQRELQLEIAENNLRRMQTMRDADAASEQELENARSAYLSAKTSLEQLEIQIEQGAASLQQDEVQLNYTNIYAPLPGTIISLDQKEGATLNASQTAPTVMQIADLSVMTVETEISEADISSLNEGVEVYFQTLGSGDRRWYGELRQIDPMPQNSNNVVLYTGRFDVDNSDGELYPGMTTQVFFVTSSAENVLTVPIGALTYTDTPRPAGGQMSSRAREGQGPNGQMPNREELAARFERGEIPPEMRQRIEEMRARGGFDGSGNFPGGEGFPGGGFGGRGGSAGAGSQQSRLSGSIALNEPRNATVQVVLDDNSRVTREIVVGATDRVNAEVISGLEEGERVLAGIVQARAERDEEDSRSNNNWRGMPRGIF